MFGGTDEVGWKSPHVRHLSSRQAPPHRTAPPSRDTRNPVSDIRTYIVRPGRAGLQSSGLFGLVALKDIVSTS